MANRFEEPKFYEIDISDGQKRKGTIRIKPNRVLWRQGKSGTFYNVPLEQFVKWIIDPKTKATKQKTTYKAKKSE